MKTVTVNADALKQLLLAVVGPAHHIRELQATRHLGDLGDPNPIDLLIAEYNTTHKNWTEGKDVSTAGKLAGLLAELVEDEHISFYPTAVEGGTKTKVEFDDWFTRAGVELAAYKESRNG
jgi:hypothetical protein